MYRYRIVLVVYSTTVRATD